MDQGIQAQTISPPINNFNYNISDTISKYKKTRKRKCLCEIVTFGGKIRKYSMCDVCSEKLLLFNS